MQLIEVNTYAMLGAAVLAFVLGGARDNGSQVPRIVGGLQILAGAAVVSMMHGWLDLPWDHVDGAIGIGAAALWAFALIKAEKPVAAFACSIGVWSAALTAAVSFGWVKTGIAVF